MMSQRSRLIVLFTGLCHAWNKPATAGVSCPGDFAVSGYGNVALVPTGWKDAGDGSSTFPGVTSNGTLVTRMGSRAYFADKCTAGHYDHKQYLTLNLLGKRMRYTTELSGAGCGCNAALYLTSMGHNEQPSECFDYYCDANNVCGESCAEIDIQEANQYAWHSTLHTAQDHNGVGVGYGGGDSWTGPRDWTPEQYGPGASCIDTTKAFEVEVSFPIDDQGSLIAMEVQLSQQGHSCPLSLRLGSYTGMAELSQALAKGMTPIISYWSDNNMLWLDGKGSDGQGPCATDNANACSDHVTFYGLSIENIDSPSPRTHAHVASATTGIFRAAQDSAAVCSVTSKTDCRQTKCCQEPGMQCYEKNAWWAACKRNCTPGEADPEDHMGQPWTCRPLGARAEGTGEEFLLTVEAPRALPHVKVGTEVTLLHEAQSLRATVIDFSDGRSGHPEKDAFASVLMKRWAVMDSDVDATDNYRFGWFLLSGTLFLFMVAIISTVVVRSFRRTRQERLAQEHLDAESPFFDLGAVEVPRWRVEVARVPHSEASDQK